MSNIEKFEELLRSDEALQEKLRVATEAYEGDTADELAVFDAVVAPLAAEVGLPFTYEEVEEYTSGDEVLSLDDLDEAAGGKSLDGGICATIGFGFGAKGCTGNEKFGGTACGFIGVGGFSSLS